MIASALAGSEAALVGREREPPPAVRPRRSRAACTEPALPDL